jgi:hypothetical protein
MSQAVTDYLLTLIIFIGDDVRWEAHVTELDTCKLSVHINILQERQNTYNTTLLLFRQTTVAMEKQQCVTCVLLCYISVRNIKIMSAAQQWQTYVAANNRNTSYLA